MKKRTSTQIKKSFDSSWYIIIVIAMISVVAIIAIIQPTGSRTPYTTTQQENLGGMVYNRGDTNVPAGFAPPYDPILTSAPNYVSLTTSTSGANTNIQVTTTKDAPTMYVYKTGYYSINGAPWQQYNLLGTMDSTNNWITNGAATATITTPTPTTTTNVYVLTYVCKQYTGSTTWYCGPTTNPPNAADRKWTIQNTNIGATTPPPMSPNCTDGIKNQDETDIDCGGITCTKCAINKTCNTNTDCVSAYCNPTTKKCATASNLCTNSIKDQDETDVDCGGVCLATCATGKICKKDNDCITHICPSSTHTCSSTNSCINTGGFCYTTTAITQNHQHLTQYDGACEDGKSCVKCVPGGIGEVCTPSGTAFSCMDDPKQFCTANSPYGAVSSGTGTCYNGATCYRCGVNDLVSFNSITNMWGCQPQIACSGILGQYYLFCSDSITNTAPAPPELGTISQYCTASRATRCGFKCTTGTCKVCASGFNYDNTTSSCLKMCNTNNDCTIMGNNFECKTNLCRPRPNNCVSAGGGFCSASTPSDPQFPNGYTQISPQYSCDTGQECYTCNVGYELLVNPLDLKKTCAKSSNLCRNRLEGGLARFFCSTQNIGNPLFSVQQITSAPNQCESNGYSCWECLTYQGDTRPLVPVIAESNQYTCMLPNELSVYLSSPLPGVYNTKPSVIMPCKAANGVSRKWYVVHNKDTGAVVTPETNYTPYEPVNVPSDGSYEITAYCKDKIGVTNTTISTFILNSQATSCPLTDTQNCGLTGPHPFATTSTAFTCPTNTGGYCWTCNANYVVSGNNCRERCTIEGQTKCGSFATDNYDPITGFVTMNLQLTCTNTRLNSGNYALTWNLPPGQAAIGCTP